MKKTYISPVTETIELEQIDIIAASPTPGFGTGDADADGVVYKPQERGAFWDYENQ